MLRPRLRPTVGGGASKFSFWKILEVLPPISKNSTSFGLFWSKVPPLWGGAPQNRRFAPRRPPLWGGAAYFFKKASKPRDVMAPPKLQKVPPFCPKSPSPFVSEFWCGIAPPKGRAVNAIFRKIASGRWTVGYFRLAKNIIFLQK